MSLDGFIDLRVHCFCDGNGSVDCDTCAGLGFVSTCIDDSCSSSGACPHTRGCRECGGDGVLVCGAPEHDEGLS